MTSTEDMASSDSIKNPTTETDDDLASDRMLRLNGTTGASGESTPTATVPYKETIAKLPEETQIDTKHDNEVEDTRNGLFNDECEHEKTNDGSPLFKESQEIEKREWEVSPLLEEDKPDVKKAREESLHLKKYLRDEMTEKEGSPLLDEDEHDEMMERTRSPLLEKDKKDNTKKEGKESSDDKMVIIEEEEPTALDGGYGWVVVFASCMTYFINGGVSRSTGLLFLQFQERFGTGAQLTVWPSSLADTLTQLTGPLMSAIVNRFSVRLAVFCGAFLYTIGLILDGFAPNIVFLFFSHALVLGLGRSLFNSPGLLSVNMYFDKRRGLATGLARAGTGLGCFALVPLIQFLFTYYGYTGTFILLGGMTLQAFIAAMLFSPLRFHENRRSPKKRSLAVENGDMKELEHFSVNGGGDLNGSLTVASDHKQDSTTVQISGEEMNQAARSNNRFKGAFKSCFPSEYEQISKTSAESSKKTKNRRIFHVELFKNIPFVILCSSMMFFTLAFKSAFTFLPVLAIQRGLSESEAAIVLTVNGALDTFGRIGSGLIMDCSCMLPVRNYFYTSLLFLIGAVSLIVPSLSSLMSFGIVSASYGMMTGAFVSQKTTVLVDMVGKDLLASSFGILKLFQTFGTLVGPTLSGALKDILGDFSSSFYMGGGCMIAAGCLMAVSHCLVAMKIRRAEKRS